MGKINYSDLTEELQRQIDRTSAEKISINPIAGLENCVTVQQALEILSQHNIQQDISIQQMEVDVDLLKVVIVSGVNSGSYIEKFVNTDNVTISRGTYNPTRQRVEIDDNTFVKAVGFSYV